jgi:tRNA C32,U32 (ribose-2'-O)-methylase TrmJ
MTRIRYRKTREVGLLESVRRFTHPTNGSRYRVMLNMNEHQWLVVDDVSDLVAASGYRVHPHKMKMDAKAALEKLGIVLPLEDRVKRVNKVVDTSNNNEVL